MRTISCSVQPRLRLLLQRRLLAFSTYSPDNTLPETENQQPTITVNNNGRRSRFPDMHNKYPRIQYSKTTITYEKFLRQYESLKSSETKDTIAVTIHGRVLSIRTAGAKLVFIDLIQDGRKVQGLCNHSELLPRGIELDQFETFFRELQKGDAISIQGNPHRTKSGSLTIKATEIPTLLSTCLHDIPAELQEPETRIRNRHVDFLVNRQSADTIRLRSTVISYLRQFLERSHHTEVQTPILADGAGGAIAQPFQTSSWILPGRRLSLRIAPELWLKRLILGGFDRIYEIGSCFRNEGIDTLHNPEFTTCEFYQTYTNLELLMRTTEAIMAGLITRAAEQIKKNLTSLAPFHNPFGPLPFARLDFTPEVELSLGCKLPNLSSPDASLELIKIFQDRSLPLPERPTLPRLLDELASLYLEPQCSSPTFITHHPECLSPLSKSFIHHTTGHRVAARAELFVKGQELVNTYEEENSPAEQRRKFIEQLQYRDEGDPVAVDENYLQALEWGLPPTGGWGCGVERLCMLLAGAKRIADVLPFGTLRNVVALGRGHSRTSADEGIYARRLSETPNEA